MVSNTQLSTVAPVIASIRQPWVEMSITLTPARLRPGSRIVALRRKAARGTRLRSVWPLGSFTDLLMLNASPLRRSMRDENGLTVPSAAG